QLAGAAAEAARDRGDPERREAGEQDTLPPHPVAEVSGGEDQGREHKVVGVDDPLELGGGRVQLADEGRERDVDDRRVEVDRERRQQQGREDDGLVSVYVRHNGLQSLLTRRIGSTDRSWHDLYQISKCLNQILM